MGYRPAVLIQGYLGALVFGGALLAASLLVGRGGPTRIRSLRFAGFVLAFFGLVAVALRAAGFTADPMIIAASAATGLALAFAMVALGRRGSAR